MRSSNTRYLVGLDHLRALAALLIVFYHGLHVLSFGPRAAGGDPLRFWWTSKNPLIALIEEGHTSVALFMVLSGFVFSSAAQGKDIAYGAYLKNRFLRIYPLFMLTIVVALNASPVQYSFLALLQTLLFQADYQGGLVIVPYTSMHWAVAVEFQFYLLFPFLHRILEREGVRWGLAAVALALVLRWAAAHSGMTNARDVAYWHLLGRIDQFLIGMLSARLFRYLQGRSLPWGVLSSVGLACALGVLVAFNQAGGWPVIAPWKLLWPTIEGCAWALLLVPYTLFAERVPRVISAPLAALGTISYSLYLLHYPCVVLLPYFIPSPFTTLEPNLASQAYIALIVLPVLLPLSALSYFAIERPFLRMRVRYLQEPEAG